MASATRSWPHLERLVSWDGRCGQAEVQQTNNYTHCLYREERFSLFSDKERRRITMSSTSIFQGKYAVIFGAGGSIGTVVAREFAAEGAQKSLFLAAQSLPWKQ